MYNTAASEIGIRHGLQRISNTVVTACSSALVALDLADLYIRSGKADLILVGGVDCPIFHGYYRVWNALRVLSRGFNDEPARASRPFTANRSGMVLSEGCGFVVVEAPATPRNAMQASMRRSFELADKRCVPHCYAVPAEAG
jgi:3-oxoacyl-[acyl-carrier-protein] synthase II